MAKCDRCDREATVHEVLIKGGKKVEHHLCEVCAEQASLSQHGHAGISKVISDYITSQSQGPAKEVRAVQRCPKCETAFADFRRTGLLGCSSCYEVFEPQLGPLLTRAHEGGTHHVGKTPARLGVGIAAESEPDPAALEALRLRVETLRRQLAEAVAAEQYERAARIRDELRSAGDAAGAGHRGTEGA